MNKDWIHIRQQEEDKKKSEEMKKKKQAQKKNKTSDRVRNLPLKPKPN